MRNTRNCGGCTACCKTHPIQALNNPAGVWCEHCNIGVGCKIYRSRPQECKDFQCDWLLGDFAEEDRPDVVRIVVGDIDLPGFGPMIALFEVSEWGLNGPFARNLTRRMMEGGYFALHLPVNGKNKIYVPPKRLTIFSE